MRTFVVGDIHGQAQKLRMLLKKLKERAEAGDALIFVGDYIDRGPDSRGVIEQVLALAGGGWEGPVTTLKGNHEELMLDFISRRPRYDPEVWIQNGGAETVSSYTTRGFVPRWLNLVPPEHLEFLSNLKPWHEDEHGIYVHAGLTPGVPPEEAEEETLLWIRNVFIESDYVWPKVVVFGHTPQHDEPPTMIIDPERLPWRPLNRPEKIGIDTGVAYGGPLSAVMLPEREFFSVR